MYREFEYNEPFVVKDKENIEVKKLIYAFTGMSLNYYVYKLLNEYNQGALRNTKKNLTKKD